MKYESKGKFRYSPDKLGNQVLNRWWLVIDCDANIGRYYRHLYHLRNYKTKKMIRPAWKEHITVIREEEPVNEDLWKKYNGQEITFQYDDCIKTNGQYWWLDVECKLLNTVREELGLDPDPLIPYHLSFGHEK